MAYFITCPKCNSERVRIWEESVKVHRDGKDYFRCKDCNETFHLSKCGFSKTFDLE